MADLSDVIEAAEKRDRDAFLSRLPDCNKDELRGSHVLHLACRNGWLDVVKELITGYNIDPSSTSTSVPSHHGGTATPVHFACTSGNIELVQYLINECSVDVCEVTDDGLSVAHFAIMGGLPILKYIAFEYPHLTSVLSYLLLAYYNWDNDLMKYLITESKHSTTIINDGTGDTLLHYACRDGYVARLQFLIEECKCDPCVVNACQHTLLYTTCLSYDSQNFHHGSEEVLKYLINLDSFDIKIELQNTQDGLNTVECAIMVGWVEAVKRLIGHCDDQNDKYRFLSFAYYHWQDSIMEYLISELGIVTNGITRDTLLHKASRDMTLDKIQFIATEITADDTITDLSHVVDRNGNTLLHAFSGSSICTPSKAVLSYLKSKCGYSINAFNHTPLEWAIVHPSSPSDYSLASIRCLVEAYGTDELLQGGRILTLAFQHWSDDIIKYLIVDMKCSLVTDVCYGTTILHMACQTSNLQRVRFLVESCHCQQIAVSGNPIFAGINAFDILHYLCIKCNWCPNLSDDEEVGTMVMKSAIAQGEKGLALVKHLVEKCNVQGNGEIMSCAWDHWSEAVLKYLIVDAKFNLATDELDADSILHRCIFSEGYFERLEFLIETCCCTSRIEILIRAFVQSIVNIVDTTGFTECFHKLHYLLVKFHDRLTVISCQDIAIIVNKCCFNKVQDSAEIVYLLVKNCISQSSEKHEQEAIYSVMFAAYQFWLEDVLKCLLLDKQCKMTVDSSTGDTVLHHACSEMNQSKLDFLLKECECNIMVTNLRGQTILHTLCTPPTTPPTSPHDFNFWFSMLTHVIETYGFHNLTLQDDFGNTIFHLICGSTKYAKSLVIVYLMQYRCDLNLKDNDGFTVLHLLCRFACSDSSMVDLIRRLVQEGKCDPKNLVESNMNSVLHILASSWTRVYSASFLFLFHFFLYECQMDCMSMNAYGDTVLHVACRSFRGDIALIERIISTGKVSMVTMNSLDETPLMLLDDRCRELDNDIATKNVKQLISRFGEVQLNHPIRSYVNVVLLGNPEVGKSSLCKVLQNRKKYTFATQYRNVKNVELHTAGIITKIIKDKYIGRIILHDLAGQAEYYSSHTAVLENLLQGSAAVFVIVVSLADENCIKSFQQWFNIIENVSHNALHQCHLIVVASHIDQRAAVDLYQLKQEISNMCSLPTQLRKSATLKATTAVKSHGIFELDCRKLGGSHLTNFTAALSTACKSIVEEANTREMSLYCHMLYDFFQRDGKSSYTLASLTELTDENNGLFLPKEMKHVENIVSQLSSTGLVVYLKSFTKQIRKSWVVADKSVLLSDLNGVLFAPQCFKQHVHDIASNTGVVKLSHLYSIFPNYDPDLLLQFLEYMQLCSVISGQFLSESNLQSLLKDGARQYIFVPALIKSTDKPDVSETVFKFGWYLRCAEKMFFLSRFIHLVQLNLACKFSIMKSSAPTKFERLCKIWTKGIHWKNTKGVEALVEVADSNQALILLMSCEDGAETDMFNLIHDVIAEILSCKQQVMPRVVAYDFIIDNSSLQKPLNSTLDGVPLYSIQLLASCYLNNDQFILDNTTGVNQVAISKLSAHEDMKVFFNAIFAGRTPNCLADTDDTEGDNVPCHPMEQQESIEIPSSMEFFHLLRTRSTHWDEIGRELGICLTYRVSLRSSITSGSLSDNNCLESILQQWVKQSNDPNTMWKHFEEAMMRLQYNDVLEMMKTSHAESASYVTHDTMKEPVLQPHIKTSLSCMEMGTPKTPHFPRTISEYDPPSSAVPFSISHIPQLPSNEEDSGIHMNIGNSYMNGGTLKQLQYSLPQITVQQPSPLPPMKSYTSQLTSRQTSPNTITELGSSQDSAPIGSPIQILQSNTPRLLRLISNPHKLANDLWSVGLLTATAKDEIETNASLSRYRKGSYVLNEVLHMLLSEDSPMKTEQFEMFCKVLQSEGDPGLERLSNEMMAALTTNT